jgi:hypothetical protein
VSPRSLLALALAASGCGITADLGEDYEPRPNGEGVVGGAPGASTGASSELVYGVDDGVESIELLAISGEYLYFPRTVKRGETQTGASLMRCEKTNCAKTARVVLDSPYGRIAALQVVGDRIGMVEQGGSASITTCTAPDCTDLVRIGNLRFVAGIRFEHDAVEWGQSQDHAIYRCTLPHCEVGPELALGGIDAYDILRSGEVKIIQDGWNVWRLSGGEIELLELGAVSRSLGGLGTVPPDNPELSVRQLSIDGDWLYASNSASTIARWPLRGYGPRQVILDRDRSNPDFTVHHGELAARTYGLDTDPLESSSVAFCRVDACDETLVEASAPGWASALVWDEDRWYWAWGSSDTPGRLEIRSSPRLPVP